MTPTEQAAALDVAIRAADAQPLIYDEQRADVPEDAVALGDGFHMHPSRESWIVNGVGILAALAQQGLVIARAEDARDGEALRELREALPEGAWASLRIEPAAGVIWHWQPTDPMAAQATGWGGEAEADTIAAAADAARAALGAGR